MKGTSAVDPTIHTQRRTHAEGYPYHLKGPSAHSSSSHEPHNDLGHNHQARVGSFLAVDNEVALAGHFKKATQQDIVVALPATAVV